MTSCHRALGASTAPSLPTNRCTCSFTRFAIIVKLSEASIRCPAAGCALSVDQDREKSPSRKFFIRMFFVNSSQSRHHKRNRYEYKESFRVHPQQPVVQVRFLSSNKIVVTDCVASQAACEYEHERTH